MNRRWIMSCLFLLALALLWGAGTMHAPLLDARQRYELDHAEPLDNAPPIVVFSTVALGGFSGVIADILWVRAAQLQLEGQYFELVQLADWITKLQPRFPEGWVYHAWNLSYNVSVMFTQPEDRWRWVRHGITLLRDGGLRYNPANPTLHRELGWLFQHKMGDSLDLAHRYYKKQWGLEMQRLFDGRGPDYKTLADTPASRSALLRTPDMTGLLEQLRVADYDPLTYEWPRPDRWSAIEGIIHSHPAGATLMNHMRLRMMMDRYRLVPARMQQIEKEYGPLDWRMPHAHAIYWAWNGLPHADGWEKQMLERMIFHCSTEAFRQGRFMYNAEENLFMIGPNPDMLPYVKRAYADAVQAWDDDSARFAHLNFLNHALTVMYIHNRMDDARMLYDAIRSYYPDAVGARAFEPYVIDYFTEGLDRLNRLEVAALIEDWIFQAFFWYALGDTDQAEGHDRLARRTWHIYMQPRMHDPDLRDRTGLPTIAELQHQALERVMESFNSDATRERLRRLAPHPSVP